MKPAIAAVLTVLSLLLYPARSAGTNDITLGSVISPSSSAWESPNKTFQLAFYAVNSSAFSVGILYSPATISINTSVWSPAPSLTVTEHGNFSLSSNGDLVLSDATGVALWRSNTSSAGVEGATLYDTGNLVLFNSSGLAVWQSFDFPTDTLVDTQILQSGASLTSGSYTALMATSGNLTLSYNDSYTYWSSGTAGYSNALHALLNTTSFQVANSSGNAVKQWYSNDYTTTSAQIIRRVKLDGDGNLRIYSWTVQSSTDWGIGWEAVPDQCNIYGYCGQNGICRYENNSVAIASCFCVEEAGYSFVDRDDPRRGCQIQTSDCSNSSKMVTMNNTVLSTANGGSFRYGDAQCSTSCLYGSLCLASTEKEDGSGTCLWFQNGETWSGYSGPSIPSTSYIKVCGEPISDSSSIASSEKKRSNSVVVTAVIAVAVTIAVIGACQCVLWWFCCRNNRGISSARYALLEFASGAPVQLSYRELKKATQGFKHKLGEGGFGAVYKGALETEDGGKADVAAKRLEGWDQGEKQFRMEVAIIGSTHHMNLVRLYGFCAEGKNRALVYEFMANGSLNKFLFRNEELDTEREEEAVMTVLQWDMRFHILLGAARGLTYLHQECRDSIVHCDIKPENILLDEHFNAKVSDFGLAKMMTKDQLPRNVTNLIRGTRGYLAPEWRSNLPITVKSDVYSYGVVLLETISGRRCFGPAPVTAAPGRHSFCVWAYWLYFNQGRIEGVLDGRLDLGKVDMEELDRAMKVAFWCLQVQPNMRPSMSRAIHMLEGTMAVQTPPPPASTPETTAELDEGGSHVPKKSFVSQSLIDRPPWQGGHLRPSSPSSF